MLCNALDLSDPNTSSINNHTRCTSQCNNEKESLIVRKSVRGPQAIRESMLSKPIYDNQNVVDIDSIEAFSSRKAEQPSPNFGDSVPNLSFVEVMACSPDGKASNKKYYQQPTLARRATRRFQDKQEDATDWHRIRKRVDEMMQNSYYEIFMAIITAYILYADNIRQLQDKSYDSGFYITSFLCIVIFLVEILILCFARIGYNCSFFFWMDLISTLTTFMDIPWVINGLGLSILSGQSNISKLNKAGRASRVSSRATKVIRIIRLIRIVRITKLYKYAHQQIQQRFQVKDLLSEDSEIDQLEIDETQKVDVLELSPVSKKSIQNGQTPIASDDQKENTQMRQISLFKQRESDAQEHPMTLKDPEEIQQQSPERRRHSHPRKSTIITKNPIKIVQSQKLIVNLPNKDEDELNQPYQETKVGKHLSDQITKQAILLMLSVIVCIPLFDYTTYYNSTTAYDSLCYYLSKPPLSQRQNFTVVNFIDFNQKNSPRTPVTQVYFGLDSIYDDNLSTNYRLEELQLYNYNEASILIIQYQDSQLNAMLGIIMTTFVMVVMVTGAILFNKDSNDLVVIPIENMLSKVKRISQNPLEAAKIEEDQELLDQELHKNQNKDKLKEHKIKNTYETIILERLIIKTGSLLAIGFGEAGGAIIAENLKKGEEVNPLVAGNKMVAIFGFCDIRNFTDMTEILQEDVMLFVNDIAKIVHYNVHMMHGSANKNIGDAFLLVWRFPEEILSLIDNDSYRISNIGAINNFTDLALLSFVKIMIQIKKSHRLNQLKDNPLVQERMKNYSVKLGYGLHLGWAIEGAIGSIFKIDASYLSPNVNMAARLETATKQYGTYLLLSGQFYHFLSSEIKDYVRIIDRITVKGSTEPIDLFTFDVDLTNIHPHEHKVDKEHQQKNRKLQRYLQRKKLKEQHDKILQNKFKVYHHYSQDPDIKIIREIYTNNFLEHHEYAIQAYFDGNWLESKKYFQEVLAIISDDGPSKTILNYMETFEFQAPAEWKGYRELTDK